MMDFLDASNDIIKKLALSLSLCFLAPFCLGTNFTLKQALHMMAGAYQTL